MNRRRVFSLWKGAFWYADPTTLPEIAAQVCETYGVPLKEVLSPDTSKRVVHPRQAIMAVAHDEYGFTYSRIGRFLKRNHATTMYGAKAHRARCSASEPALSTGFSTATQRAEISCGYGRQASSEPVYPQP